MLEKMTKLLWLTTVVLAGAGSSEVPEDFSPVRPFVPGTPWSQRPLEDFRRREVPEISHARSSHQHRPPLDATENYPGRSTHLSSSQDYRKLVHVDPNFSGFDHRTRSPTRLHLHLRPRPADHDRELHFRHPSRQTAPSALAHQLKPDPRPQTFRIPLEAPPKKTAPESGAYPRVHRPYVMHRYPIRTGLHPHQGKHRLSPYQRYALPSGEFHRLRLGAATPSTPATADALRTTERMDDAHAEGSSPHADAHGGGSENYYESYDEAGKTDSGTEEIPGDETATRGYYGDRIYMSTQPPVAASNEAAPKNKYYIIRRTSDDEDIETIFE